MARQVPWRLIGGLGAAGALALGLVAELAVLMPHGAVGEPASRAFGLAVGRTALLLPAWPIGIGLFGLYRAIRPAYRLPHMRLWGAAAAHLALIGLFHVVAIGGPGGLSRAQEGLGGGLVGFALGSTLSDALGQVSAMLLLGVGLVLGLMLAFEVTLSRLLRWSIGLLVFGARGIQRLRERRKLAVKVNTPGASSGRAMPGRLSRLVRRPSFDKLRMSGRDELGVSGRDKVRTSGQEAGRPHEPAVGAEPVAGVPRGSEIWKLPPVSIFEAHGVVELSQVDARQRAKIIEETLGSFNIEARVVEINQGPTVTQFGIEPASGVPVRKILALQNDLGLRLAAWPVRFEAPVPGKRVVGLEVPNQSVAVVSIRELLESEEAARMRSKLRLALGRDVSGRPMVVDLGRMPHLLIAGATGSGKSVCINSILASLLSQNTPDELQFMMIDPKMVELMPFNGIPHLRMPVVTDMEQVVGALKWVVREMDRRYALFVRFAARNLESFNRTVIDRGDERPLPYLVVVIDELADMMMTSPDEVEVALCRLAQKARATGIHLIVATQRPSVDVVTGMIKANFVTRIAFAVSSGIDSRVILDTPGAEKLLGRGDMLYSSGDTSKPVRIQGAWVSDDELQRLVNHWRRLGLPRFTDDDVHEMEELNHSADAEDGDDLYDKAVSVANQYSRVSTSLLQRRLGVGYPRAARLIDLMEERGVVSTSEDGKSREVLQRAEAEEDLERYGSSPDPSIGSG